MAVLEIRKVIGALPSPLEPHTLYAVRTGAGFDLFLSDMTGTVAHSINPGDVVYPVFDTAAEADAYTAANPGRVAFARNAP